MSDRRQVLAEGATDYVLEHGLIGPEPATAGRCAGHQRPDAALPLRGQARPGRDRAARLQRPLRAGHPGPGAVRRPAAGGASTSGPRSARRSRLAASGCTSRPRRSACWAPSRSPPWSRRPTRSGSAPWPTTSSPPGCDRLDARPRGPSGGGGVHGPPARRATRAGRPRSGAVSSDLADAVTSLWGPAGSRWSPSRLATCARSRSSESESRCPPTSPSCCCGS